MQHQHALIHQNFNQELSEGKMAKHLLYHVRHKMKWDSMQDSETTSLKQDLPIIS